MKKLTKLNISGSAHLIALLLVVVLVGIIGTYLLVASKANSLNCSPATIDKVSLLRCSSPCPTGTSGTKKSDGYYYCFGQARTSLSSCTSTSINKTPVVRCNDGCPAGTSGNLISDGYFYCFGTPIVPVAGCAHVTIDSVAALRCNGGCPTGTTGNKKSDGYYYCFGVAAQPQSSGASGYANPFRSAHLTNGRVDQGVDFGGTGPIYALGSGTVVHTYDSGWPDGVFIVYQLTGGKAAGKYVYVAEDCTPKVSIGATVTVNTVLCQATGGSKGIETGWAMPPGHGWYALAHPRYSPDGFATNYGQNFSALLHSLGGPSGTTSQSSGIDTAALPSGWPTW